jgi:hypothetical protein
MNVCLYVHKYVRFYGCIYGCECRNLYTCACECAYENSCVCICILSAHVHALLCTYVHSCTCVLALAREWMYACMYVIIDIQTIISILEMLPHTKICKTAIYITRAISLPIKL